MERFNKIQDDAFDVGAARMNKFLEKHDAYCTYNNGLLKFNWMAPIQKNKANHGQANFSLPKRVLNEVWDYYKLEKYEIPKKMRIYIMIKIEDDTDGEA